MTINWIQISITSIFKMAKKLEELALVAELQGSVDKEVKSLNFT